MHGQQNTKISASSSFYYKKKPRINGRQRLSLISLPKSLLCSLRRPLPLDVNLT